MKEISKPAFIQEISPMAARYAHEVIENAINHEDAVNAVIQDFMNGAVIAYDLLKDEPED